MGARCREREREREREKERGGEKEREKVRQDPVRSVAPTGPVVFSNCS